MKRVIFVLLSLLVLGVSVDAQNLGGQSLDGLTRRRAAKSGPPSGNQPPTCAAQATPHSGTAPLNVAFTGFASDPDGFIVSYLWEFGDGNQSSVQNPFHTYGSAGAFVARLTVTDNSGASGFATVTISVQPSVPSPTVEIPNNNLPAEIVLKDGERILKLNIPFNGTPDWLYYDGTTNQFGAINVETGTFDELVATRNGDKAVVTFSAVRTANQSGTGRPPSRLTGTIVLDGAFFTITTTGHGSAKFRVLDGSRPNTVVGGAQVCVTTQFVPMVCAIGVLPGFTPPVPTH